MISRNPHPSRCLRPKWFLLLVFTFLLPFVASAQIAPTSVFQLNGNAASTPLLCSYDNGPAHCDYWNLLNGAGAPTSPFIVTTNQIPPNPAVSGAPGNWSGRTFINGLSSTNVFQTGGSKDPNDTTSWRFVSGNTPNKDTLNAAYAAAYSRNSDLVTIFGADRLSNNGDANIGIWFFQALVVTCPQPAASPNFSACSGVTAGHFSGQHTAGDILVLTAFTGGGVSSFFEVLAWDTGCTAPDKVQAVGNCADSNLRIKALPSTLCGSSAYCGVTNAGTTTSSWEGNLASPLFFEGGVDISFALGTTPCFTSFLVETRSSQSTSAVLKDFLGGGFPVCSISINKSCTTAQIVSALSGTGQEVLYNFTGTITNTGSGPLTLGSSAVTDTFPAGTTAQTLHQPAAGVLAQGASTSYSGSFRNSAINNSLVNTVSVTSTTGQNTPVTDGPNPWPTPLTNNPNATPPTQCSPSPQGSLSVSKTCSTQVVQAAGGGLTIEVNFTGSLTNTCTGQGCVTLTGLSVDDAHDCVTVNNTTTCTHTPVTLTSTSLAPGASEPISGTYFPKTCSPGSGVMNSGVCVFTDTLSASGSGGLGLGTVTAMPMGDTCSLCPAGVCFGH